MPDPAPAPLAVLLVGDHRDGGDSLAELLRLLGYEVRLARSGVEAMDVVASFAPDVVVLDIGLPDGDGYWLAGKLVAALARRPVLIPLTGYENREGKARAAGIDHYLLKPVEPAVLADLLARLASHLGG